MNNWEAVSLKLGGISRSQVFKLWRTGQLDSVTIGSRRFSTDAQVSAFITKLESVA